VQVKHTRLHTLYACDLREIHLKHVRDPPCRLCIKQREAARVEVCSLRHCNVPPPPPPAPRVRRRGAPPPHRNQSGLRNGQKKNKKTFEIQGRSAERMTDAVQIGATMAELQTQTAKKDFLNKAGGTWLQHFDKGQGKPCWYHSVTNQAVWDKPTPATALAASPTSSFL
jgi:hypothetical protein